jgi:hypothetical protein
MRRFSLLLVICSSVQAATISTTFDNDLGGWQFEGSGFFYQVSGFGNPPGCAIFQDQTGPQDGVIRAPNQYLGSWVDKENHGSLSFDQMLYFQGDSPMYLHAYVILFGYNGMAWYQSDAYISTVWQTFTIPIREDCWYMSGSWKDMLTNVFAVQIRVEASYNSGPRLEISAIDNIILTPEPNCALLVLVGLVFIMRRHRPTNQTQVR